MNACGHCGVPVDAGYFDRSSVVAAPEIGQETVLASYALHRNYCGVLVQFAQFTDRHATDPAAIRTDGYVWEIRSDGQPLAAFPRLNHIINPWGLPTAPVHVRVDSGARIELVLRNVDVAAGDARRLTTVGGRIIGRYWYDPVHGTHTNGG